MWHDSGCYEEGVYATKEEERASERLTRYCNSMERIPKLLEMREVLPVRSWLRLLGESWSAADNIAAYIPQLLFEPPISNMDGPIRAMMSHDEWEEFLSFPETLEIYRGCYEGVNENGCCWSLDKNIARRFPTLVRYRRSNANAILRHGTVWKHEIIAYKNDRNEREVIIRTCDVHEDEYIEIEKDQ